jgi:hypothetical protein
MTPLRTPDVAALAGLEPGDVATLVGLVRRYLTEHDIEAPGVMGAAECDCSVCSDARPFLAGLP